MSTTALSSPPLSPPPSPTTGPNYPDLGPPIFSSLPPPPLHPSPPLPTTLTFDHTLYQNNDPLLSATPTTVAPATAASTTTAAAAATAAAATVPVIMQPIILYQSLTGQSNDSFYNPHTLFNQREFIMRSGIEYVLLIYPTDNGDHLNEHHIICPGNLSNPPEGKLIARDHSTPQALCLQVKHTIPDMTLLVPNRTPLSFLLRSTKLQIKMFTIPLEEAEHCKKNLLTNYLLLDLPPVNAPHRLVMFDDRPSHRLSPYYVPHYNSTAAAAATGGNAPRPPNRPHNLLMRRSFDYPSFFSA